MPPPPPRRECFVTIGATATFTPLLTAALSPPFLTTLAQLHYTHLILQCGADLAPAQSWLATLQPTLRELNLHVRAFGFNDAGLGAEMRGCKAEAGRTEGVVVCHAGAGTILDAMRLAVPLIVVPNPALLDNHQAELAAELARLGYVVHARLDALPAALRESEAQRAARTAWTVGGDEEMPGAGRGKLMDVVDQELGYETRAVEDRRREEMVRGGLD